ncbi:MAG: twin-arginine translocase TatA/TatE family subunit [Chloroflexi bacterium]|nr:twin-arginine translocase TatA/TatE family subunit [Chloroflexota bacterium]
MNFLGMGPAELMLILVLALIIFGPGKLPEIAGQVGKAVRDFRRATSDLSSEFNRTLSLELEERKATQAAPQAAEAAPPAPDPATYAVPVTAPAEPVAVGADVGATSTAVDTLTAPQAPVAVATEPALSVEHAAISPATNGSGTLNGAAADGAPHHTTGRRVARRTYDADLVPPY